MSFGAIAHRLNKKWRKRKQRKIVKRWWDDGGDYKLRFNYDLNKDSLVLDLGGYEGQWASDLFSRYRCRIAIFEPVSTFASRITERFQKNEAVEVFQCGLGGATKAETIHICGAGSSTYRKKSNTEEIRIIDVREWFSENHIESIQLMKINIEGGEFELLERLIETRLIESIDNIQVQFHNIALDSARRMESIQRGMERTHVPTYQYRFVWENWTRRLTT